MGDIGRVLDTLATRLQFFVLPQLRIGTVDTVDGFTQIVRLLTSGGLLRAQSPQPLIHGGQLIPCMPVSIKLSLVAGHTIKEFSLTCGGGNFQLIGLPVNGHQFSGNGTEHRSRHGFAAKYGTRSAGSRHSAREEQLTVFGFDARIASSGNSRRDPSEVRRIAVIGIT